MLALFVLAGTGRAQRCGVTDTIDIAQLGETRLVVPISGYLNGNLAATNQSLCNVKVYFQHTYVYGLTLSLVSPAGDTVQLVGPQTDQSRPPTSLARWFIDFQRCSDPAAPDPGAPLRWNNANPFNWPAFGTFTGSYYPSRQCLTSFNEGSLNGDWELLINNSRDGQQGIMTFLQLEFCDDRHSDGPCCLADAGEFPDLEDISTCAEPSTLPLNLRPRYRQPRPNALEYGYTYAVFRNDSLIDLQTDPNLAGSPAGRYEICGLSHRRSELGLLPLDGFFSPESLRNNLEGSAPILCGNLATECQVVNLVPPPDTTFLLRTICSSGSTSVGNSNYSAPGLYRDVVRGQFDCDSVIVLDLRVVDTLRQTVDATICAEDFFPLGDRFINTSGRFQDTLSSQFGCDSIVTLNLTVNPPIRSSVATAVCAGEVFSIGDEAFSNSGVFTRTITAADGCDSTVTLDLIALAPSIQYEPFTPQLDCRADSVVLDAGPSQLAFTEDFGWYDITGQLITNELAITVREPGAYVFRLSVATRGIRCEAADTVMIAEARQPLEADLGFVTPAGGALPPVPCTEVGDNCNVITCRHPVIGVDVSLVPIRPGDQFSWQSPSGMGINSGADSSLVFFDQPGRYNLRITSPSTGCTLDTFVDILEDVEVPRATVFGNEVITCANPAITLNADTLQDDNDQLSYRWTPLNGGMEIIGSVLPTQHGGTYRLSVENRESGCSNDTTFTVPVDTVPVLLNLAPAAAPITCFEPERILSGGNFTAGHEVNYVWTEAASTEIIGQEQRLTVRQGGLYELVITDIVNGCADSGQIAVPIDTLTPIADAGPPELTLNCFLSAATLGGQNTSTGVDIEYAWRSVDQGLATVSTDRFLPVTATDDIYLFSATNSRNGCANEDTIRVRTDLNQPIVELSQPIDFDCFVEEVLLEDDGNSSPFTALRSWTGPCLPENANQSSVRVACPGIYTHRVLNLDNGCETSASVEVFLADNSVVAILPDTLLLDCTTGTVQLNARNSSPAASVRWLREGREVDLTGLAPEVDVPGNYQLILGNFDGSCLDTASVFVTADCPLLALLLPVDSITCNRPFVTADATFAQPASENSIIDWLIPADMITQEVPGVRQLNVFTEGRLGLVVTNTISGLSDTAYVDVIRNQQRPIADAGLRDTIDCYRPRITLDGTGSSQGLLLQYLWTDTNADTIGFGQRVDVTVPGTYLLEVTQTETGCSRLDNVVIIDDRETPQATASSDGFPCDGTSSVVRVIATRGDEFTYEWSGPNLIGPTDLDSLTIGSAGTFLATVTRVNNGCSATAEVAIPQLPCPPFPALSDTVLTCAPGGLVLRPTFRDGCADCTFRWSRNGVRLRTERDSTLSVSRVGTYEIVATNEFGLTNSVAVNVMDARSLPSSSAGDDRIITCREMEVLLGRDTSYAGRDFEYNWSLFGTSIPNGNNQLLATSTPGTYTVQVVDRFSLCSTTDTVTVGIDTLTPRSVAGPMRTINCDAKRRVLDGTDSDFGRRLTYAWTSEIAPACIDGGATLNPIVRCEGTYELTVRDTVNGCSATSSTEVARDEALPAIVPLLDTTLNCSARAVELIGGVIGVPAVEYGWEEIIEGVGNPVPEIAPGTIAVSGPGLFRFQLVNTRSGCTNEFEVNVSADLLEPVVDAGLPDTFQCDLNSLALDGRILENGASSVAYTWTSRVGFAIDEANTLGPTIFQPDRYFLTAFNTRNQCSDVDSVDIIRDERAPIVDAGLPDTVTCALPQVPLNGSFGSISDQGIIHWTTVDGELLGLPPVLDPTVSRPGTYQLNITDPSNGCSGADLVTIAADTVSPTSSILAPDGLTLTCNQPQLVLRSTLESAGRPVTRRWFLNDGQLGEAPTQAFTGGGSVQLRVTDVENGCLDTSALEITEDLTPPVFATEPIPVLNCLRDTAVVRVADADFTQAYSWLNATDSLLGVGRSIALTVAGQYQLVSRLLRNGCADTIVVPLISDRVQPRLQFAEPEPLNCERQVTILDARGSSQGERFILTWTAPEGDGGLLPDPYRYRSTEPGTHRLTITDIVNGCQRGETVEVERVATPIDSFLFELTQPECPEDDDGELLITGVSGGNGPFRYRINGGLLTDRLFYEDLPLGDYQLTAQGSDGCTTDANFSLLRPDAATLEFRQDTLISLGDSLQLNYTTTMADFTAIWSTEGTVLPSIGMEPIWVRPFEATRFVLELESPEGCRLRDAVFVEVEDLADIYVPTAFSPNADGTNDLFRPFTGGQVQSIDRFTIYNRWGARLYDSQYDPVATSREWGWDGTVSGRNIQPQTLVWKLEATLVDGRAVVRQGSVILLR
ncbi:gliding motility-associated C-terminal domain-containing protein [Lewinella sp. 4G2]|uniref:gliding motility-associated C-terminal domain-containing protein n=1 Tax=Lewinella sp. 4G2 TaxID=1803372 RepID=UPI0018D435E6|nr:gliding motility-associated C-terminal domain-containing protein [Lewinella sp. 4G2]